MCDSIRRCLMAQGSYLSAARSDVVSRSERQEIRFATTHRQSHSETRGGCVCVYVCVEGLDSHLFSWEFFFALLLPSGCYSAAASLKGEEEREKTSKMLINIYLYTYKSNNLNPNLNGHLLTPLKKIRKIIRI